MKSYQEILNESSHKDKMAKDELIAIYNNLEKGDNVTATFDSPWSGLTTKTFKVSKGRTKVGKAKVERIILQDSENPKGVKYYLYYRSSITLAIGDMATSLISLKSDVNEDSRFEYNKKQLSDFVKTFKDEK